MSSLIIPVTPSLSNLLGSLLLTALPGGPYLLPATLQPMLLVVLKGEIRLHHPVSGACESVVLPQFGLCGATRGTRAAEAAPGTEILLASLKAGQLPRLFGLAAQEIIEEFVPFSDLLPHHVLDNLSAQIASADSGTAKAAHFETFLLHLRAAQMKRGADLVLPEHLWFRPLQDIASAFSLSPRQFERHFVRSYGQSLRTFRQQARCSRMLVDLVFGQRTIANWASVAADSGYFDQAHLIRDFRRFTGYTPTTLGQGLAKNDPALWPYQLSTVQVGRLFGSAAF